MPCTNFHSVLFLFLFPVTYALDTNGPSRTSASPRAISTFLPFASSLNGSEQCLSQILSANASSTITVLQNLDLKKNNTMPRQHQIALSLTVDAPGPASNASEEVNSTIWLGIDKSTDYQNPDLPFSACSLVFNDLPDTIIARGASLDGLCTQTFSENCVADLQKQAADMAWDFTKNSSQAEPHKNGTFSRLPEICNFLADQMTLALPDSCRSFAEDNRLWETVDTLPLTGQETSGLTGCNVSIDNLYRDSAYKAFNTFPIHQSSVGPPGFNTSTNATGIDQLSRDSYYHRIMENVVPVMRIYMPTANENTSPDYIKIDSAQAEMSCLKASTGPGGGQNPAGLPSSKTSGSSTNIVPSVIGSAFAMLALSVISMSLYC